MHCSTSLDEVLHRDRHGLVAISLQLIWGECLRVIDMTDRVAATLGATWVTHYLGQCDRRSCRGVAHLAP